MASRQQTVDFILKQIERAGVVSAKKMFGEFGIYCDGKMAALVCDDQFFVKITPAGRAMLDDTDETSPEAPPYPGAKPCFLIEPDRLDDHEWLTRLVRVTTRNLPQPSPKAPNKRGGTRRSTKKSPTAR